MTKRISTDDTDLFRRSIGKVKPVKADKIVVPRRLIKRLKKDKSTIEEEIDNPKDLFALRATPIGSEAKLWFARSGVQNKQLKSLQAGKLPCEAECDLHNLTQTQAEEALEKFIYRCQQQGLRVVRIVHGKGKRTEPNEPVLKNLVNQRLREFAAVLAFCSAMPRDGGTGAIYVLLKSKA